MGGEVSATRRETQPIPALRRDLDVRFRRDETVEIRDPRLFQILSVDGTDYAVAALFDGAMDADAVRKKLTTVRVTKARVLAVEREFAQLHLLDTPEARAAVPMKENVAPWGQLDAKLGLTTPPVAQPGATWSCHGCGACCHNLAVELSPEEEARIDATLYRDVLKGESYYEEQFVSPDEPAKKVLRQHADRNFACIFLAPDGLCYVHARQGMAAKPNACQAFPLMVVHVPRRPPRLGVRVNCQSMYKSFDRGPEIAAQTEHAFRVYEKLDLHRAPDKLELFGAPITFATYERLAKELLAFVASSFDASALSRFDRKVLGGRVKRSRARYALGMAKYEQEERSSELPTAFGSYSDSLRRVRRWKDAYAAMAEGKAPPLNAARVQAFYRRQLEHVLYMCGPLNAPDTGYGFVALLLGIEAAMHAVGAKDDLVHANHAFDVFTSPILETLEHLWPVLQAIDARYAQKVKEEMA